MINIGLLKESFDYKINHAQQGTYTIDQFNHIAYLASLAEYNFLLGLNEQIIPQTKNANVNYAVNRKVHTDMLPFKIYKDMPLPNSQDTLQLPHDVGYILNVRSIYYAQSDDNKFKTDLSRCGCTQFGEKTINNVLYKKYINNIKHITEDKWADKTMSAVTKSDIYCQQNESIDLHFKKIRPNSIRIEYIKKPIKPKWNYVLVDGVPVYEPVNSVHLEWGEWKLNKILERMDNIYSRNVSDGFGTNFSQAKIQRGE